MQLPKDLGINLGINLVLIYGKLGGRGLGREAGTIGV